MKVNIMPCRYPLNSWQWPLLMQAGIEKHGDIVKFSQRPEGSFDTYVFWGLKRHFGKAALQTKKPCVVVERAFLGERFKWHSIGLNGLNGKADFKNQDVEPDRWNHYWKDQVKPWSDSGEYALIAGQLPGDASLYGKDPYKWASEIIPEAKKRFGKVVFRPHPRHRRPTKLPGVEYQSGDLQQALKGAKVVITYSSNLAVDAVMNGVPAISFHPGSMAYSVTSHSINDELWTGNLDDWGRKIAYAQWLPQEMKEGKAWEHFRKHILNGR